MFKIIAHGDSGIPMQAKLHEELLMAIVAAKFVKKQMRFNR
jgi:hypothetical protein